MLQQEKAPPYVQHFFDLLTTGLQQIATSNTRASISLRSGESPAPLPFTGYGILPQMANDPFSNYPFSLSPKQKKFADQVLAGSSSPDAAESTFDTSSRESARVMGHKTLSLQKVQDYIHLRCLKEGLIDAPLDVYKEALKAVNITRDREGNEIARDINYSARLQASNAINRILGIDKIRRGPEGSKDNLETITIIPEKDATEDEIWYSKFVAYNDGQRPTNRELAAFRKKHELQEATEEGSRSEGSPS
jgi:hypothetical protein